MKHAIVGSLTALLAGAGLALAQQQPDEALPRPRIVGAATAEAGPDQGGAPVPGPGYPGGDPGTAYGPPPSLLAPACGTQGPPTSCWAEGDYHLWWLKKNTFPTLLLAVPAAGVGAPGTASLAGGDSLDRELRNGGGLTLGTWLTEYQGFGLEGNFFIMEESSKSFSAAGTGAPGSASIVRPFFDVLAGRPAFAPVAVPGLVSGSASGETEGIHCDSGRFAGFGFDFIGNLCCDATCRLDFLVGYRYLTLDDRFGMTVVSVATDGIPLPNGQLINSVTDTINTSNRFNGFDIGLRGQWFCDCWMFKATAKVAFGATDQSTNLTGLTQSLSPADEPTRIGAGFLVRPSNQGGVSTEQFTVVPECDLAVGFMPCGWMRVTLGYSFLYWSSVVRTGNQVDLNINRLEVPSLVPVTGFQTTAPGQMRLHCSDFWAHGLNVGLEFRF
jgi:hypothetical protein